MLQLRSTSRGLLTAPIVRGGVVFMIPGSNTWRVVREARDEGQGGRKTQKAKEFGKTT